MVATPSAWQAESHDVLGDVDQANLRRTRGWPAMPQGGESMLALP